MKIEFLGHSCFCIELATGTKIVTDPYETGAYSGAIKYAPINVAADIVTASHHHPDHNFAEGVLGARLIDTCGVTTVKDATIEGIQSFHDDAHGALRGENIIFVITAEGMRIAHFGDLGTLVMPYEKLQDIAVAMVPVGGRFTINHKQAKKLIDTINPKIIIPMHFKTNKLDFDIDGVEKFILGKDGAQRAKELIVIKETLPEVQKIILLEHTR